MCGGGGGGGGSGSGESLALQRQSLQLSKDQFAETKRQWKTSIQRSPGRAPISDVNGIRSEPGNTRLSQDDGSMHKANSLK